VRWRGRARARACVAWSEGAAAAIEAEEEAGVTGAVCPVPLGSYRYRKKRGSGASLLVDVDVFPLAVTGELPTWKEQHQRERRWFSLTEAAEAVDEPDLRELFRSFAPGEFRAAVRRGGRPGVPARATGKGWMFAWFQRLLPRTGNFFGMFEAHAATVLADRRTGTLAIGLLHGALQKHRALQQHGNGIFNKPLKGLKPSGTNRPVNSAMVGRKGDAHHRCHCQIAINNNRPLFTGTNRQNTAMRRINDRGKFTNTKHAKIGNCKAATGIFAGG